jgi:hypothetical protein
MVRQRRCTDPRLSHATPPPVSTLFSSNAKYQSLIFNSSSSATSLQRILLCLRRDVLYAYVAIQDPGESTISRPNLLVAEMVYMGQLGLLSTKLDTYSYKSRPTTYPIHTFG